MSSLELPSKEEKRLVSFICSVTPCDCYCHTINDICAECARDRCSAFISMETYGL